MHNVHKEIKCNFIKPISWVLYNDDFLIIPGKDRHNVLFPIMLTKAEKKGSISGQLCQCLFSWHTFTSPSLVYPQSFASSPKYVTTCRGITIITSLMLRSKGLEAQSYDFSIQNSWPLCPWKKHWLSAQAATANLLDELKWHSGGFGGVQKWIISKTAKRY